ncbi:hypothetical protein AMTR_s00512p00009860, partial [Amborella trichopoda]
MPHLVTDSDAGGARWRSIGVGLESNECSFCDLLKHREIRAQTTSINCVKADPNTDEVWRLRAESYQTQA